MWFDSTVVRLAIHAGSSAPTNANNDTPKPLLVQSAHYCGLMPAAAITLLQRTVSALW
jgi:hypothetical protein